MGLNVNFNFLLFRLSQNVVGDQSWFGFAILVAMSWSKMKMVLAIFKVGRIVFSYIAFVKKSFLCIFFK